jgi:hypothetical protein
MVKIMLKDIVYLESLKDYIRVKTLTKEIISLQKISFLEEKLPEDKFLRIPPILYCSHRQDPGFFGYPRRIDCQQRNSDWPKL